MLDLLTVCLQPESVRITPAGFEPIITTVKEWCPSQLDEGVKCADLTLPHQSQRKEVTNMKVIFNFLYILY